MSASIMASTVSRSGDALGGRPDTPNPPKTGTDSQGLDMPPNSGAGQVVTDVIEPQEEVGRSTSPALNVRPTVKPTLSATEKDGTSLKDAKLPAKTPTATSRTSLQATAGIDPLSQHILMRTGTDPGSQPRLRYPTRPDSPAPDALQRLGSELSAKHAGLTPSTDGARDKKKGVSFLSRLSMRARKKDDEDPNDDISELGEPRPDGTNARVFSSAVGSGGYIPHHKEPPRYIRVRAHNKKTRDFNRMFLAQELLSPPTEGGNTPKSSAASSSANQAPVRARGAIWAMEFSRDGRYLAAAGKDGVVRIWAVLSTCEERQRHQEGDGAGDTTEERLSAPVFRNSPICEFQGHTGEILDLSWSKNNFLLSTSIDKTVRLWHVSRDECLCTFKHKDIVASVAFHPTDDRFFLAGSLDSILRLWSIPDKAIAYSAHLPDLITAVAFSPDGRTSIAGVLNGTCLFLGTEGLTLQTQMVVRSSRGRNAKGSKITGIKTMPTSPHSSDGDIKVLITSNDSRIRIYNLRDKTLDVKMKGHQNLSSQIHASFSDDAKWVICGSEDKRAFIWSMNPADPEKVPFEYFDAHSSRVSVALFAPTSSRQLLGASGDPLYDLCNPPPVKLMSLEESLASSRGDVSDNNPKQPQPSPDAKTPAPSAIYLEKSKHLDGNIIVTADQSGVIKVFRQDCAFVKRRHENWETGSNFSRKIMTGSGLVGRSGSVRTRTSAASSHPHSRRASLSQSTGGPHGGPTTTGPNMSSDRINSWRQGIGGAESNRSSVIGATSTRSERSMSPSKAPRAQASAASEARKQPYASSPTQSRGPYPSSPASSVVNSPRLPKRAKDEERPSQPPTPSFSFRPAEEGGNEGRPDPGASNFPFWNLNRWRGMSASLRSGGGPTSPSNSAPGNEHGDAIKGLDSDSLQPVPASAKTRSSKKRTSISHGTGPERDEGIDIADESGSDMPERQPYGRMNSVVSQLSSECPSEEGESMTCSKCGSSDFKKKYIAGKQRAICGKCGTVVQDAVA